MVTEQFMREAQALVHLRRHKHKRNAKMPQSVHFWKGWQMIGSGHYGEAWQHDSEPDLVVKISGRSKWGRGDKMYSKEWCDEAPRLDAWGIYAWHCKNNPHPNLLTVHHIEDLSAGMTWAILPRYVSYTSSDTPDAVVMLKNAYCDPDDIGDVTISDWARKLIELKKEADLYFDLHDENYMVDKAGNVVITDPFTRAD